MKLLITGGCGFLGSNLAAHAIEQGIDLVVFDNLSRFGAVANLQWLQSKGRFQVCTWRYSQFQRRQSNCQRIKTRFGVSLGRASGHDNIHCKYSYGF